MLHMISRSRRNIDIVPRRGRAASLTALAAGVMAFLALLALALSMAAVRLAGQWGQDLARSATIHIPANAADTTARVLQVLAETPGIASARPLSAAEIAELLSPWFGGVQASLDDLPLPHLIALETRADGFDANALALRLQAEAPGAKLEDHSVWRVPLAMTAQRLRVFGFGVAGLALMVTAIIVTLAAQAALAANMQVVAVLRLIGASDGYITNAFIRRFSWRAGLGAAAGTVLGIGVLWLLPPQRPGASLLPDLHFSDIGWVLPAALPVMAGLVARLATARAVRHMLKALQ